MQQPMTIGVLETGLVPEELVDQHSTYPDMFTHLLGQEAVGKVKFERFCPLQGDFPTAPDHCDAWLVTGSKYGVYEDIAWIHQLRDFLRQAYQQDRAIIGICFGHQLLAEALGGKVIKSPKGWGCGAHTYAWTQKPDWMEEAERVHEKAGKPDFAIQAYHQDQVVALPKEAQVIASSEFCDYAALSYEDKAISFQGHPEFSANYATDLFLLRQGDSLPHDVAQDAIDTKDHPLDRQLLAKAIMQFLHHYQLNRSTDNSSLGKEPQIA